MIVAQFRGQSRMETWHMQRREHSLHSSLETKGVYCYITLPDVRESSKGHYHLEEAMKSLAAFLLLLQSQERVKVKNLTQTPRPPGKTWML